MPSKSIQQTRMLQLDPPFDDNQFSLLIRLQGSEGISELPYYYLTITTANTKLKTKDLLGKLINFTLHDNTAPNSENPVVRNFHGLITNYSMGEVYTTTHPKTANNFECRDYTLTVSPSLWLLTKCKHNRVFQQTGQTVIDIVDNILKPFKIVVDTSQVKQPKTWEYCMQYNETDFDFFSRILAEAGIYYYFTYEKNQHKLILANTKLAYIKPAVELYSNKDDLTIKQYVHDITQNYQVYTTDYSLCNANIKQGNQAIIASKKSAKSYSLADSSAELSEFIFPEQIKTTSDGEIQAEIFSDNAIAQSYACIANSNYSQIQAGSLVKFTGKTFNNIEDKEQVTIKLHFEAIDRRPTDSSDTLTVSYHNQWESIPCTVCFRPKKINKPHAGHFQLATVVNSKGEVSSEQIVNCDEYGQHSIKFIWEDNSKKTNKFDACRIRVLNMWDNGIYRVGTPVIVGFIDDDIDKPVILGATNDAMNLIQGKYSNNNYYSSIIKRLSGVQNGGNYNSLTFNDQENEEKLSIFAGKDMLVTVNKGDLTSTVEEGNEEHLIKKGTRKIKVQADEQHTNESNYNQKVAKKFELVADGGITLKSGDSVISITASGIKISTTKVDINGTNIDIGGSNINIKGMINMN